MASWRVARSLDQLLAQINAAAPNRSKVSDGSIGDTAHASRVSDHNPDSRGIVHARDYTHDPANGCDIDAIFAGIVASGDRRVSYLIRSRRITQWQGGRLVWTPYDGTNPHDAHGHVSVTAAGEDDTRPWQIGPSSSTPATDQTEEDEMARIMRATERADALQDGPLFLGLNPEESKNLQASGLKLVWITAGTWDALAAGKASGQTARA